MIQAEKEKYWKAYRRHYQRSYRSTLREVAVRFSPSEYKELGLLSSALGVTVPTYIRTAALSDAQEFKESLSTNENRINLSLIQSDIENLIRNHVESGDEHHELYMKLLERVRQLEEGL